MTMLSKIALAAGAVLALGTAASAADAVMPLPVTPVTPIVSAPAYDWSGFYAGANIGYQWGEIYDEDGDTILPFDEINGINGGAQLGVNAQFDMFVLGAEADIQLSGAEQEEAGVTVSTEYFGTVRARAGVALDAFMPYITGGLAYGETSLTDGVDTFSETALGWTAGAGLEAAVTDNVTIKAEYLYVDLGEANFGPGAGVDIGNRFHTFRVGANWQF